MINIPINALKQARKLLTRLPFTRCKLPVLGQVLARTDAHGVTFAVSDLDHWLETRLELATEPRGAHAFLIPAAALATAVKADKGSEVCFLPKGRAGQRELKLVTISGGMKIETMHSTADWEDFPDRPLIEGQGPEVEIPAATFEALKAVSPCASRDENRHVLNGVLFTPEQGEGPEGMLVATNGKHLAGAPAVVPGRRFILPNAAVRILAHPEFSARTATVTLPADATMNLIAVRAGAHLLLSRTLEGDYPAYRQVIPKQFSACIVIPEDRRAGLSKWLRTLRADSDSVCLSVERSGELTLARSGADHHAAILRVPATVTGTPPAISFHPGYLAEALEIGGTLRLSDAMSPIVTEGAGGRFCVVMPLRTVAPPEAKASPAGSHAAA